MTEQVIVGNPEMTTKEAANLMRGHIIGCLPIVEGDELVGIVTISDLLELLGKGVHKAAALKERQVGVNMPSYPRTQH